MIGRKAAGSRTVLITALAASLALCTTQVLALSTFVLVDEPPSRTPVEIWTWRTVGGRTRVSYRVEFSTRSPDLRLGSGSGHCWEDDFTSCARRILNGTRDAAKKLQKKGAKS